MDSFSSPKSSNIHSALYYPEQRQLKVTFRSGHSYSYEGFPDKLWKQFKAAVSKGTFFSKHVRDKYAGQRIINVPPAEISLEDRLKASIKKARGK